MNFFLFLVADNKMELERGRLIGFRLLFIEEELFLVTWEELGYEWGSTVERGGWVFFYKHWFCD